MTTPLSKLKIGQTAQIKGFREEKKTEDNWESQLCRFMELGIQVGALVTLCHRSPFGGFPLAIKVQNQLIGLGFEESSRILVEPL